MLQQRGADTPAGKSSIGRKLTKQKTGNWVCGWPVLMDLGKTEGITAVGANP